VKFLLWIVVNAVALAIATWLLRGISLSGATTSQRAVTLVVVALIFGVINAVVRPVVKLLSLPFIILTLGLLVFVINACMLLLTSWVAGQLAIPFAVHGFLTAVYGAIIIMIATWILELVLPDPA
jgi:putative membrane protein